MAHLIEQMAYVGQTWHGLGNELTSNQPLEVWAKQAGLDWLIQESPVRFATSACVSQKCKNCERRDNILPCTSPKAGVIFK